MGKRPTEFIQRSFAQRLWRAAIELGFWLALLTALCYAVSRGTETKIRPNVTSGIVEVPRPPAAPEQVIQFTAEQYQWESGASTLFPLYLLFGGDPMVHVGAHSGMLSHRANATETIITIKSVRTTDAAHGKPPMTQAEALDRVLCDFEPESSEPAFAWIRENIQRHAAVVRHRLSPLASVVDGALAVLPVTVAMILWFSGRAVWAVLFGFHARGDQRMARGLCPHCAFPMARRETGRCTECGGRWHVHASTGTGEMRSRSGPRIKGRLP